MRILFHAILVTALTICTFIGTAMIVADVASDSIALGVVRSAEHQLGRSTSVTKIGGIEHSESDFLRSSFNVSSPLEVGDIVVALGRTSDRSPTSFLATHSIEIKTSAALKFLQIFSDVRENFIAVSKAAVLTVGVFSLLFSAQALAVVRASIAAVGGLATISALSQPFPLIAEVAQLLPGIKLVWFGLMASAPAVSADKSPKPILADRFTAIAVVAVAMSGAGVFGVDHTNAPTLSLALLLAFLMPRIAVVVCAACSVALIGPVYVSPQIAGSVGAGGALLKHLICAPMSRSHIQDLPRDQHGRIRLATLLTKEAK
ncbi:MAG: hypothetical protein CSA72_02715 [Rhodobacterales bacterium]|nr:MAG: hypothetical protein CSA72_02715 [Rhodobacterales bacterium]